MQQIIVLQHKTGILEITYGDTLLYINCTCTNKYVRTVSLYIYIYIYIWERVLMYVAI
jgi:hypothetical protein